MEQYQPVICPRCGKKDVRWNSTKGYHMCRVCGKTFVYVWSEKKEADSLSVALSALDEVKTYIEKGNCNECALERIEEIRAIIHNTIRLE